MIPSVEALCDFGGETLQSRDQPCEISLEIPRMLGSFRNIVDEVHNEAILMDLQRIADWMIDGGGLQNVVPGEFEDIFGGSNSEKQTDSADLVGSEAGHGIRLCVWLPTPI